MSDRGAVSRRFTMDDQRWFGQTSGDVNPIHVDEITARRSLAGAAVVHGVHVALWALDSWADESDAFPIGRLRATFRRPVVVGEEVAVRWLDDPDGGVQVQVTAGREVRAVIAVVPGSAAGPAQTSAAAPATTGDARPLDFGDAAGLAGREPLVDALDATRAYPAAARVLGSGALAGLLATSRIVGMECPGLHSLLAGIDVEVAHDDVDTLAWRVTRASSVRVPIAIEVEGPVAGTVTALFRQPPTAQPSYEAVAALVSAGELDGHRALVVGGSRGLGELTAKIVAAGGGHPILTYARGRDDAVRVAAEITAGGGRCDVEHLDVLHPRSLVELEPTHLYYFATPAIRAGVGFDADRFDDLVRYYVRGFWQTCADAARPPRPVRVLYPSSSFVASPTKELAEYAAAKSAGEALCAWMNAHLEHVTVLVERFPPLRTDQTGLLLGPPPADPLVPIVAAVRRMHVQDQGGAP